MKIKVELVGRSLIPKEGEVSAKALRQFCGRRGGDEGTRCFPSYDPSGKERIPCVPSDQCSRSGPRKAYINLLDHPEARRVIG